MKALGVISTTALFLLLGSTFPAFAQDEHHEPEAKPAQHEEQAKPAKREEAKPAKQETQAKPAKQEEKPAKQEGPKQAKSTQQNEQKQAKSEQAQTKSNNEKQAKSTQQNEQKQAKSEQAQTKSNNEKQAKSTQQNEQKQAKSEQAQTKSNNERQAKSTQQNDQKEAKNQEPARSNGQPQRTAAQVEKQRAMPALRLSASGSGRIPDDRFRSNFGRGHEFRIGSPRIVDGYSRFQYGGYWFGFVQPWPMGWYYTDDVYVDFIDGGYYLCNPYYPDARVAISVVL